MIPDQDVLRALMRQVHRAMPAGQSERSVKTLITRPMWRAFLRSIKEPENLEPTDWIGLRRTVRVWGSETIVIESSEFFSISYAPEQP